MPTFPRRKISWKSPTTCNLLWRRCFHSFLWGAWSDLDFMGANSKQIACSRTDEKRSRQINVKMESRGSSDDHKSATVPPGTPGRVRGVVWWSDVGMLYFFYVFSGFCAWPGVWAGFVGWAGPVDSITYTSLGGRHVFPERPSGKESKLNINVKSWWIC